MCERSAGSLEGAVEGNWNDDNDMIDSDADTLDIDLKGAWKVNNHELVNLKNWMSSHLQAIMHAQMQNKKLQPSISDELQAHVLHIVQFRSASGRRAADGRRGRSGRVPMKVMILWRAASLMVCRKQAARKHDL
jgi:hypothetical protein